MITALGLAGCQTTETSDMIKIDRDPTTGRYLFPDTPDTFARLQQLRDGLILNIDLTMEHQDA